VVASIVFQQLLILFGIMFAGLFLSKKGIIDERVCKGLTDLLTYAMQPAFLLGALQQPRTPKNTAILLTGMGGMFFLVVLGMLLAFLLCKLLKVRRYEAYVWMCLTGLSNLIYVGKPIVEALYGGESLFVLSAAAITFNIAGFTVCVLMVTSGAEMGRPKGFRAYAGRLLNPTAIAGILAVSLYFLDIQFPLPVAGLFHMMSSPLTPLSMLIIGFSLSRVRFKELLTDWKPYALTVLRLFVCPILAYLMMREIVHDRFILTILFVGAAMPAGAITGVICEQCGSPYRAFASKSIVISTLFCLISVPLLMRLLGI
jgi:predicted permease